ncbi:MAG: 8-amino-7-oxononanoate synthase [Gammaproteobacteria bacterium]|nr:8-amino-7-oxononanoate synthase [Gammaproteobacteria bacterium]
MPRFSDLQERLDTLRAQNMYRKRRNVSSRQGRAIRVDGRELLNFCSNDYLGLAGDVRVAEAFKTAVERWGVGAGASHLVCGHTQAHEELETTLAEFTGRPRALVYSSGYAANVGVINALLSVSDLVCEDRLNHASLLDGGWISRARFAWYGHLDHDDLDLQLASDANRKLVVSDGTFSMDGDRCRLDDLIAVARRRDAWVMVDDAHGMGVHGPGGVGLVDPARYTVDDVQVLVGTFGKAFGTSGAGSEALIETLIQRSRNYIYTTAMPPAIAVATLASLAILRDEAWRRDRLEALIARFREGATRLGFTPPPSTSPIQPLIVGEPQAALDMSRGLEERGCLCTAIRPPSVPEGTSRLRITLTAAHTDADVDRLIGALEEVRKASDDETRTTQHFGSTFQ